MPTFLVEAYEPCGHDESHAEIEQRVRTAAAALSRSGAEVRFLRSIYVPTDETCFHLFDGPSIEVVEAVGRRAELTFNRVTEAIEPALSEGGAI